MKTQDRTVTELESLIIDSRHEINNRQRGRTPRLLRLRAANVPTDHKALRLWLRRTELSIAQADGKLAIDCDVILAIEELMRSANSRCDTYAGPAEDIANQMLVVLLQTNNSHFVEYNFKELVEIAQNDLFKAAVEEMG